MLRGSKQCSACKHYRGLEQIPGQGEMRDADQVPTCAAFPAGIPDKITLERFDHRKPWPGDGGIRWEPAYPGAEETLVGVDRRGERTLRLRPLGVGRVV